jgi:hypothetical protein
MSLEINFYDKKFQFKLFIDSNFFSQLHMNLLILITLMIYPYLLVHMTPNAMKILLNINILIYFKREEYFN